MQKRSVPIDFDCGSIKRDDHRLRMKYYGLKTRIYLLRPGQYMIQLLNYQDKIDLIRPVFDHSIRMVTDWVSLSAEPPVSYLAEIPPLEASDTPCEGLPLTDLQLKSLLISRFPKVSFYATDVSFLPGETILRVTVSPQVSAEQRAEIQHFLYSLNERFHQIFVEPADEAHPEAMPYIDKVFLACTDVSKPYSVSDADFWFDNEKSLFQGELPAEQLRFYRPGTKCYLDLSVFSNSKINLRSNLMLYDTVYLCPPLKDHLADFMAEQHLSQQDFETMAEQGKLVMFLPNNENRYESGLIDRIYAANPNAVVSKRGINALMAAYYTNLEQHYLNLWQGHEELLAELSMLCTFSEDPKLRSVGSWLTWPIQAKAQCKELLTISGPMQTSTFGISDLFAPFFPKKKWKNVEFEFLANGSTPQIAAALHATYFPFQAEGPGKPYSDEGVATLINQLLNGYLYPYDAQQETLQSYRETLERSRQALRLLRVNNAVPVKTLLEYSNHYQTTTTLKNILEQLTSLPDQEQTRRIQEYNELLAEIGQEKFSLKQNIPSYVLSCAGLGFPSLSTPFSILGILLQLFGDLGVPKALKDRSALRAIQKGTATQKQEVYLLDRISRVAQIQLL